MRRKNLNLLIAEKLNQYEAERAGLKIGSLVLVRNFKRRKFDLKWVGPAVVTEVKQNSVKAKQEKGQTRNLNRGDIKPYKQPNLIGGVMLENNGHQAAAVEDGQARALEEDD